MSSNPKLRQPGKLVFEHPKPRLTLVKSTEQPQATFKQEFSEEVKEMLRDMNRRRAVAKGSDAPDAA